MAANPGLSVMLVHNRYLLRGGEDVVFESEAELLQENGCHVIRVEAQSQMPAGLVDSMRVAGSALWSRQWYRRIREEAARHRPDVIHVHNFFPTISSAVFFAARKAGVPAVMTLHNFRLLCPGGSFFRDGRSCKKCADRIVAIPAIRHGCYRDSRAGSAVVAGMLAANRLIGTWSRQVGCFIALTEFSKSILADRAVPAEKIFVKPNFARELLPAPSPGSSRRGGLFVGRICREKGIGTILQAWSFPDLPLRIIGSGPLAEEMQGRSAPSVEWAGQKTSIEVAAAMRRAAFLLVASESFENFPVVVAEAFCNGLPVIASRLGPLAEIVQDGRTGLHFTAGDPADLAAKIRWASENPSEMAAMGLNARREYEAKYNPAANFAQLMAVYRKALELRADAMPALNSAGARRRGEG